MTEEEVQQYTSSAKDIMVDATEYIIYMCGMTPLEPNYTCFDIFQCNPALDYYSHIESEFYTSKIQPTRVNTFCHCAGKCDSPVELNTFLKAPDGPYSVVLPICEECLANGCRVVVRSCRHNAQDKQANFDAMTSRAPRSQGAKVVGEAARIEDVEQNANKQCC
jgi:hypothetical protein